MVNSLHPYITQTYEDYRLATLGTHVMWSITGVLDHATTNVKIATQSAGAITCGHPTAAQLWKVKASITIGRSTGNECGGPKHVPSCRRSPFRDSDGNINLTWVIVGS